MKISIIGATGYAGAELVKILLRHPMVDIEKLTSKSFAGRKISNIYPSLVTGLVCEPLNIDKITSPVVFTALPHGTSMEIVAKLYRMGKKVIDLSADFRLKDAKVYEKWYKIPHKKKNLLWEAVYGLPELYREKIRKAQLVANPGCYPTSAILALAPLVRNKILNESVIVDAKSGISGAGRGLTLQTHFPEANENISAYRVEGHRHLPEIEQEIGKLAKREVQVTFIPHLIPVNRGILSTCYAKIKQSLTTSDVIQLYQDFYEKEPFVEILPEGDFPQTKEVLNSNRCRIGLMVNSLANQIIIISAIDNLGKGASWQAVQNMNLMCGFEEEMGLNG
ncbi:N-acetyl-gamma-glutamyl-phosphate reductase [Patescibacteria group bacterium]|nr:N-acetyl-gamma-glutamyl-phosphate reductase [Patescibacteria group bacterium]